MIENKLIINIRKSAEEIFNFTLDPKNTPLWIDSIIEENIDTSNVGIGTIYTNVDREGQQQSYIVSQFEKDKLFQLDSTTSSYHVRYIFTPVSDKETRLEYFEWDESGLANPFKQEVLEKLRTVLI